MVSEKVSPPSATEREVVFMRDGNTDDWLPGVETPSQRCREEQWKRQHGRVFTSQLCQAVCQPPAGEGGGWSPALGLTLQARTLRGTSTPCLPCEWSQAKLASLHKWSALVMCGHSQAVWAAGCAALLSPLGTFCCCRCCGRCSQVSPAPQVFPL